LSLSEGFDGLGGMNTTNTQGNPLNVWLSRIKAAASTVAGVTGKIAKEQVARANLIAASEHREAELMASTEDALLQLRDEFGQSVTAISQMTGMEPAQIRSAWKRAIARAERNEPSSQQSVSEPQASVDQADFIQVELSISDISLTETEKPGKCVVELAESPSGTLIPTQSAPERDDNCEKLTKQAHALAVITNPTDPADALLVMPRRRKARKRGKAGTGKSRNKLSR
jgi:hypothetical protein